MGEKSDSKKKSSPYVVLENRPLDQWRVPELKEELKKRNLMIKGLKEELVKRLDAAVRAEMDDANKNLENDFNTEAQPEVQSYDAAEETADIMDQTEVGNEGLDDKNDDNKDVEMGGDMVHTDDGVQSLAEEMVTEGEGGAVTTQVESYTVVQETSVETTVLVSEKLGGKDSQMIENENMDEGLNQENGEPKLEEPSPEERPELGSSDLISGNQVDEVSQVQSDSISIDTITNIEKNEIKDNVIADDVKLEIDAKPEMILDHNSSESVEVDEHHKDKPTMEEKDANIVNSTEIHEEKDVVIADDVNMELGVEVEKVQPSTESAGVDAPVKETLAAEEKYVDNTENVDICKVNDSGDVGSPEKLNLDGDDSMEEDIIESKQIDSKLSSDELGDKSEKIEVKDDSVHSMAEYANADKSFVPGDDKKGPSVASTKRKPYDQEGSENSGVVKRQRRWNTESLKVPEQSLPNHSASTTPKDAFQTLAKRTFSRSESTASQDSPKERVVPPTSSPPTTSLRIDQFLRPFTLKAVQELLGKTGTVVSFWMDQIKTHCYVTYASVEEAIATRNAVCNLQWPAYGGRLLMADFVDPQEVKNRVDPPPPSPAPPVTTTPPATTMQPPQPSPRQKQQLPPPPTLPPPPPLSNAPPVRARAPPPPEKIEPPILTLDDLFKKTRATPRIYYLPLSDEQVAAKTNAQGKPVKH